MKKNLNLYKGMRPAAVMLLCTCIAFSAVMPYTPPSVSAAAEESSQKKESRPETDAGTSVAEEDETSQSRESIQAMDETAPAPYRLNFAYMYDGDGGESYAEILMRELIQKDSQWYAGIYDMANMAPSRLASRLGVSQAKVLGKHNPASSSQDPNDPSTWAVEHFKNVRVSFYDGDGNITSAVSNAQQILSMASVYCYYNDIHDLEQIRRYTNQLWSASHSYSAAMGDVYFCAGCVDPSHVPSGEETDSELEGEDYFNGESSINTEISVAESQGAEGETDENGETITGSSGDTLNSGAPPDAPSGGNSGSTAASSTEKTTPAFAGTTVQVETTTSPLDSLAETAESVYIEETKPKVTIIRPGETQKKPETSSPSSSPAETSGGAGTAAAPSPAPSEAPASSEAPAPETSAAEPTESRKAVIIRPEEPDQAALVFEPEASGLLAGADHSIHTAAVSSENVQGTASRSALICPGHIDLRITARVQSLEESENLFSLDTAGSTVEEGRPWTGWTDRTQAFVNHISRQDWTELYGITVTVEGTKAPLSSTEIESYMKKLPADTSEERKEIIRFALQSVGKIPYYWGGKASARNYSGNNFGSITIPDHRGRILKGLDCSGWINWVYWSVTGERLPYEGTEGLKATGRPVARADLKPGDIIVITGKTPHVIMFLSWAPNGQIQCIHETGSANNVTVSVMTANWPYYRNLLD